MTDENQTPEPEVYDFRTPEQTAPTTLDVVDHTGRTTGTRWYWEDMDGWNGPLTQESAQKASDTYGVGSEIRPYKTYGINKRTRDLIQEMDDESLESLIEDSNADVDARARGERRMDERYLTSEERYAEETEHKFANTRSYPGLAGFFARWGKKA